MKNLLRLYFSYSVEVVSVVVELLLKETGSSDFLCLDDDNHRQSVFDYWKSVITKLSNKEPEFLLTLIKTVHDMIETEDAKKCRSDTVQGNHIDRLSDLFASLVIILKGLKSVRKKESGGVKETCSADTKLPKPILVELLRKSLLVSCPGNSQLNCSTLVLANMVGKNSLVEKLNKLFLLSASNLGFDEENSSSIRSITQQEDSIKKAAEKLELLKLRKMKSKATDRTAETNEGRGWVVVKKWKKCPIGMLSLAAASSGLLPVLDLEEDHNQVSESSENKEQGSLVERNLKRKPDCDLESLNEISGKKKRENGIDNRKDEKDDTYSLGVQGNLMIGGVWKKVEEQELFAIAADIRVFV